MLLLVEALAAAACAFARLLYVAVVVVAHVAAAIALLAWSIVQAVIRNLRGGAA